MPGFPAYCPRCKSVFPFHGIGVGSNAQIQIGIGPDVGTNCPVCGYEHAEVSEAIYSANSSVVTVLSAPESSQAVIEAFFAIVEDAAKGRISPKEAKQKAENLSPQYASTLEKYYVLGIPGLTLLLTIIQLYLQIYGNQPTSKDFERLTNAITEQTFVLKDNHYISSIERDRSRPPHAKSGKKSALKKHPFNRRAQVRKERRATLRGRWQAFGRARTH